MIADPEPETWLAAVARAETGRLESAELDAEEIEVSDERAFDALLGRHERKRERATSNSGRTA